MNQSLDHISPCVFSLTLFSNEWQTPSEHVHEIGQPVRMWGAVELADIHDIILILEHSCLIVVYIQVVWC